MNLETKGLLEALPAILEASSEAIASLDADGNIRGFNSQFQLMTNIPENATGVMHISRFFRDTDNNPLEAENTVDYQVALLTRTDGVSTWLLLKIIPVGDPQLGYKTLLVQEPDAVRRILDRLDFVENYDTSTGLLNRRKGLLEFEHLQAGEVSGGCFLVNLGQPPDTSTIDDCLKLIARHFNTIEKQSITCRLSETELLFIYTSDEPLPMNLYRKLLDIIKSDSSSKLCNVQIAYSKWLCGTLSVKTILDQLKAGMLPIDDTDLLEHLGINRTPDSRASFVEKLFDALEHDRMEFYIQPQVSSTHSRVIGGELLVRWVSTSGLVIPPSQFVDFLETGEFAYSFFTWSVNRCMQILRQLFEQCGQWVSLSLNLATPHLADLELMEMLVNALKTQGIARGVLEVEITERILAEDQENVLSNLQYLAAEGVKIAIDDFGTGYSSLSYLRKFPLDRLKIDRVFVTNLADNEEDRLIVNSIVSLAHVLGLEVIAEGVEDNAQACFLRDTGCEYFQGYLTGKPQTVSQFTEAVLQSQSQKYAPAHAADFLKPGLSPEKPKVVRWKKSFSTDVVSVDNEHRLLIDALNQFADGYHDRPDNINVLETLDTIASEAIKHFDHEESVMFNIGYPGYKKHCEKHKWLLADISKRRAEIAHDPENARFDEVLQYLKYWLMRHMINEDTHLHRFINKSVAVNAG